MTFFSWKGASQGPISSSKKASATRGSDSSSASPTKVPWKKPPGFPKRPLSTYNIFVREEHQKMKDEDIDSKLPPAQTSADGQGNASGSNPIIEHIESKWRVLSEAERQPYQDQANVEKE